MLKFLREGKRGPRPVPPPAIGPGSYNIRGVNNETYLRQFQFGPRLRQTRVKPVALNLRFRDPRQRNAFAITDGRHLTGNVGDNRGVLPTWDILTRRDASPHPDMLPRNPRLFLSFTQRRMNFGLMTISRPTRQTPRVSVMAPLGSML
ncbi:hypothetical protein GCM10011410_12830 [Hoyosella rhizosphaerae]|uniref:Uncharacterized protein n=1 Tax=Hoyosella rhizosphaerae TaxID=1755582 RepID=A0A916XBJ8_9ACTN|nr:hypothetical protein GCM10011410_12830 [Hoyosella rhizosphaerae]